MANRCSARNAVWSEVSRNTACLALALFLGVAGWLLAWPAPSARAGGWVTQCADCPKMLATKTDRSLRLDAAGHPHLVFGGSPSASSDKIVGIL